MATNLSGPKDVWIDTDPAVGVPGSDVDDGLALIQAFHSPEMRVRGVSAVFGNAPLEQTFPIATDLVQRFGPAGVPVAKGAASGEALGEDSEAVRGMAAALGEGPLDILALGPLTNVASLVMLEPELAPHIGQIISVAARRPGQRFRSVESQPRPFPDLNFDCDPAAMQVLIDSGIDLVFAPWEVSSHVWLTENDLDGLEDSGESGQYIAQHSRSWLKIWRDDLGAPGFNPFDTLAIAWVSHPHLLEHFRCGVWIEEGPDDTAPLSEQAEGRSKPHLLVDADKGDRAVYCHHPASGFKPLLLDRLARPG